MSFFYRLRVAITAFYCIMHQGVVVVNAEFHTDRGVVIRPPFTHSMISNLTVRDPVPGYDELFPGGHQKEGDSDTV